MRSRAMAKSTAKALQSRRVFLYCHGQLHYRSRGHECRKCDGRGFVELLPAKKRRAV